MNDPFLFQISAIFATAGLVKGISGLGLPTFSMALLTLIMPAGQAASLMIFPSLTTNTAQCFGSQFKLLCKHLWPLWLSMLLGTLYWPLSDVSDSSNNTKLILGLILSVYGVWGFNRTHIPDLRVFRFRLGIVCGILCGCFTASTGIFAIPLVPFLQSLRYSKEELIQALGLSFTVATIGLMFRMEGSIPSFDSILNTPNLVSVASAFLGLTIGSAIRERIDQTLFRKILNLVFIALGVLIFTMAISL
jgi:uncharacterized membrane protein YfcA